MTTHLRVLSNKGAKKPTFVIVLVSALAISAASFSNAPAATRHVSRVSGPVCHMVDQSHGPSVVTKYSFFQLFATSALPYVKNHADSSFAVTSSLPGPSSAASTTADSAKSILLSNNEMDWNIDASTDSFLHVTTMSFSGSKWTDPEPLLEWALRGIVPSEFNQDRRDLYRFILSLDPKMTITNDSDAFFFGHRATTLNHVDTSDSKDSHNHQAMASAVFLRKVDPSVEFQEKGSVFEELWENMGAYWGLAKDAITGKLPAPLRNLQNLANFISRFPHLMETLKSTHETYGPHEAHLYVHLVAMDPDFQGRGFGKQLMNQVAELCDGLGLPCYLECAGERNPRFYEKFGFHVVHESLLADQEASGPDCHLFHMTREPKAKDI